MAVHAKICKKPLQKWTIIILILAIALCAVPTGTAYRLTHTLENGTVENLVIHYSYFNIKGINHPKPWWPILLSFATAILTVISAVLFLLSTAHDEKKWTVASQITVISAFILSLLSALYMQTVVSMLIAITLLATLLLILTAAKKEKTGCTPCSCL